ncbi:two-component system regulatory protein YycI [Metabacillus sp. Hm71]|uniref:two-component system regulatory protein YycI n=1 Tax=Metabacillus sp. Hm71 TaxID=3450743 RepID=UPI003F43A43E
MEWSKTKTIFILAFLILDIFLAIEFFELRGENEFAVIQEAKIEEQLATEGIKYGNLPDDIGKSSYITSKSKDFTLEDISKLKNQKLVVTTTNNFEESFRNLRMELDEPFPLPEVNTQSKINQFLKDHIISGELYHFWYRDEQLNAIICVQKYNNRYIFQNKDEHIGMVILYLNDDNEIFEYQQSMLEDIKEVEDKEQAVSALKAIEALFNKRYLKSNSEIKQIKFGYYTHIPLSNQQILAPTWHIVVETEEEEREEYYVHALEGDVLQSPQ